MSELKDALNSGLKAMTFSEEMKNKVLEGCKQSGNIVRKNRKSFRRTLVPIVICLALCISITAAAKVLLWNDIVAKKYGVNSGERMQEETLNAGLADLVNISAKDNNITVEVIQTVATNNRLDIYLKVQAKNEEMAKQLADMVLDADITFDQAIYQGDSGRVESYAEGDDYLIYNLDVEVLESENGLNGDKVYLKIYDFCANNEENADDIIEGEWNLSWTLRAAKQRRTIEFNKEYVIYGKTFKLQKVVLSPTTIQIYMDRELIDEQGLWSAEIYAIKKADKGEEQAASSVNGFIDENYYTVEWRGGQGIPLSVYKDWSEEERKNAEIQIENGIYQGEYIDTEKWLLNNDQYKIVDPWRITDIRMTDGTSFSALEGSTTTGQGGMEDCYLIDSIYDGYLIIEDVASIRLGDCVIPFKEGTEK